MAHSQNDTELVGKLAGEFVERYRRGERPPISEYVARYPDYADDIRELFPALVLMENVGPSDDVAHNLRAAQEEPRPQLLGDFRIIREVGRGGMGVVYEAEQVSLGRRVALKVLPRQTLLDSKHAKRFEREARAAAKLHHTNIVPVFGVGTQEGLHYYVMQFIHGLGLDEVLVELKRLREASEFPHATAEHQIASVVAAGAAEKAAVGKDVSALDVAQSLVSGRFERTLIVESDSGSGQPSAVSDQESGDGGGPATTRTSPLGSRPATREPLPDTTVGCLSETAAGSGAYALPGQSEAHRKAHSRSVYWQSVARIGVQAAEALQYAHDQGVIHRDVKPGNLLLDTRGCVWVTDFGLAKATDQQDLTHTGDVLGTLRYMAPEQFDGKADSRSDVYALGLTLYELLALQPGFDEKDRHKLIKQVTTGAPARLRTLDSHIPRDLETIVHKAIERDAAQRYQTAGELAADLQRYLGDEPIRARRISPVTRFARWCKRNPAVASLTTTIAVLLAAAAAISSVAAVRFEGLAARNGELVVQANADKTAAEAAQKDAEEARDHEKELREEAERQKDRANTNFALARQAVDEYLSKVTEEELLSVPGLQPLREDLLKAALTFYTEFTQEQSDDPTLQIELASAQHRLGLIQRDLGNGAAAQSANQEAIRLLESLRDQETGGVEVLSLLADAYFYAKRYDDTIALCQTVLETNPDAAAVSRTLAETYNTLAKTRTEARDLEAALGYHQQAFEIRQKLVQQHPEDAAYNASLASTINNLGVLLSYQQKAPEKLAMFQLALPYNEKACQLAPHSVMWGQWMAITLRNIGSSQRELGQQPEALAAFQRQADVWRRLVAQNPAVSYLRSDYYKALRLLADQQRRMGLTVESNRSNRDALDVLAQLRRETPAELFELATVYASLAAPSDPNLEPAAETPDAADERQRQADLAMQALQQAVDAGWADPVALKNYKVLDPLREREQFQQLAKAVETVAEAQKLLAGNAATDAAKLADQQKALEVLNKLGAAAPDQMGHRKVLASTYHSIGVIQTGLKKFEEAEKSLEQARQLREQLRLAGPNDPFATGRWLATRIAIGQLYWDKREPAEAHRRWQECLEETLSLAEAHRDNKSLVSELGEIERKVFQCYASYGLLPLLHEFVSRNVEFERVAALDTDGFVTDGEFSAAVLGANDGDLARRYFQQLVDTVRTSENRLLTSEVIHLVRGIGALGEMALLSEELKTRSQQILAEKPDQAWIAVAVALLQFRAEQYAEAQATLAPFAQNPTQVATQVAFLDAAIAWKRGDGLRSRQRWADGDSRYRESCREALTREAVDVSRGVFSQYWWQQAYDQATRRLAAEVMSGGQPPPDDPWQHLIQARGYQLIGEGDKAEAELAAAKAAVPEESNDADFWLAVARLHGLWNEDAAAVEASWAEAIKQGGTDPLPLIHRGRWYAERGEQEKADADFARAASLTPNELNKFLEAGWWVVGPYPAELRTFCPPELDPDPAQPVYTVDLQTGLSDQPAKWGMAATGDFGRLEWASYPGAQGNVSSYALAHVYAPQETTATLCVSATKEARIWVNDELVHHFTPGTLGDWSRNPLRVPFVLRQGRNTILVKGYADSGLTIRLGDYPFDRGMELARYGEWQEAADQLQIGLRRSSEVDLHEYPWRSLAAFHLAAGDVAAVRNLYDELLDRHRGTNVVGWKWALAWIGSLAPDVTDDPETLVELAESLRGHADKGFRVTIPMAYARAGRWQDVIDYIAGDDEVRTTMAEAAPLLALAHQQLGQTAEAQAHFARIVTSEDALNQWSREVPSANVVLSLLLPREASLAVTGSTEAVERRFAAHYQQRRADRDRFSSETFAFDTAIQVYPQVPQLYLARGRRLAALGRFGDADADFNKAVELAPNDVQVAAARALYLADSGDVSRSADEVERLYRIGFGDAWHTLGFEIESRIAARPELMAELLRRQPENAVWHRLQGDALAVEGRWQEACESYMTGDPYWTQEFSSAAIAALLDDAQGFHSALERVEPLFGREPGSDEGSILFHRAWMQALLPCAPHQADERVLELQTAIDTNRWDHLRPALGIAQYRAGQHQATVEYLSRDSTYAGTWHTQARAWPVLAMAHWQLGNQESARQYLERTANYLRLSHRASRQFQTAGGAGLFSSWWLTTHALQREARTLIDGPEAAAAELARLTAPADEITPPRPTAEQRAEESYRRAVAAAPNDPLPLIHRGRWHAQRGEQEKADADFAQAASLTPHELNKFLEAGWWVVGPYPAELSEFCPPEIDPDPSQPVRVIDPGAGISDDAVKWRTAPSGKWGTVERKNSVIPEGNTSVYALAYVHSPEEQTKLLMIGRSQPLRVWVNGTLVEDFAPGEYPVLPHYEHFHRVPVVLRAGRNTLLVKSATPIFLVRIADTPRDRAFLLAEQRRFSDAAKAFDDLPLTDKLDKTGVVSIWFLAVLALEHEDQSYERVCSELVDWAATQPSTTKHAVAYICAQTSNAVFEQHVEQLVPYAEELVAINSDSWVLNVAALVNYRAGRFERARSLFAQSTLADQMLPLRALLAHQSGDKSLSEKHLDESLSLASAHIASWEREDRSSYDGLPFPWWFDWATYLTLLREAEQAIRNETTQSTALYQQSEAIMTHVWTASPERAAFDLALIHNSRSATGDVKFPQPFVARGRRLAELGRFDEAEADFNQAVELAPTDRNLLVVRARFHARRGNAELAAADLDAAFKVSREQKLGTNPWCNAIDLEFLQDPAVADRLAALQPDRPSMVSTRLFLRGLNGDAEAAAADLAKLRALGRLDDAGCHALLLGDRDAYEEICREAVDKQFDPGSRLWLLLIGQPACVTPADLVALAEQIVTAANGNARSRQFLGIAQYRAGQYEAAAATLAAATDRSDSWQHDVPCWPVLAMAHHRLGHTDEAQKWLGRTAWYLDLHQRHGLQPQAFGLRNVLLAEYATTVVAYREAKALIESAAPESESPSTTGE